MKRTLLFLLLALTTTLQAAAPVRRLVVGFAPRDTFDFNLVAGFDRGRGWRDADTIMGMVGTRQYTICTLTGNLGTVEGSQPRVRGENGVQGRLTRKLYRDAVLLNGDMPDLAPVKETDSQDPVAHQAVAAFLSGQGVQVQKPTLSQNLRVDLDADGQAEYLVAATHRDPYGPDKKPDEYSLLAIVKNGQVTPLFFQSQKVQPDLPWEDQQVLLVANLDGQGGPEIVSRYEYYEGGGVVIMGQVQGAWKDVARTDWGL
ncbi:MAG: hypothetical protein AMXMBFR33_04240 [Candidatus Xenobia bacterium]